MSDEKIDEGKGRAKEAAGALTDDEEMKREGKIDRLKSSVKEATDDVAEKAKGVLGKDKGGEGSR